MSSTRHPSVAASAREIYSKTERSGTDGLGSGMHCEESARASERESPHHSGHFPRQLSPPSRSVRQAQDKPDPHPGHRRARLFRLLPVLALLLGALGLFHAAPAQAQSTTLVSNLGQAAGNPQGTVGQVLAQGFTTESTFGGYTLSSIEAVVFAANATQRATIRAELWSAATGGGADSKLADLTVPSTVSAGTVAFTAPANTTLSASTTYYVVLYTVGAFDMGVGSTVIDNEDSDGRTGWSIANVSLFIIRDTPPTTGASWTEDDSNKLRIRVKGTPPPPAAPTGLDVTSIDEGLYLEWTAPSGTVTGYDVHYTSAPKMGMGAVTDFAAVQTGGASAGWVDAEHTATDANWAITSLTNGTPYRVRVRAKNANGAGAWVFGAGTPQAPTAPTNLVVTPGDGELELSWTAAIGLILGHDLHYTSAAVNDVADDAARSGNDASVAWITIDSPPGADSTSWTLGSLSNGTPYRVRLRAFHSGGQTSWIYGTGTPVASVSPAAPTDLTVTPGDGTLVLSWTASVGTVTAYHVDYTTSTTVAADARAGGQGRPIVTPDPALGWVALQRESGAHSDATATSFKIAAATIGTPYRVRVRASNAAGASAWVHGTGTPVAGVPLVALALTGAAGAEGTYRAITLSPSFSGRVLRYTAAVPHTVTHVKLTPTIHTPEPRLLVGRSGSTLSPVGNGSPVGDRGAIALDVGANVIEVRAGSWLDAGTLTTYTVTVTRHAQNAPAAPGGLAVTAGDGQLDLAWTAPAGTLTGYDVHYTSALDTAVPDGAAVQTGGSASAARGWVAVGRSGTAATQTISELDNGTPYRVRVRAENANGKGFWAQATGMPRGAAQPPAAPTALGVTAGDAQLALAWTAPSGTLMGYDVHYTSALAGTVANDAAASGNDPAAAWVAVSRSGAATTQTISGLDNGTPYRVRVRARNAGGNGAWVFGAGTPQAAGATPTVRLSASPNPVTEGSSVTVTATLSGALAGSVTIPVTITDGTAEPEDHGTLTSIRVAAGATSGTGTIATNQDTDTEDETFTVALGALPSEVAAGSPSSVRIRITDDDRSSGGGGAGGGGGSLPPLGLSLSVTEVEVYETGDPGTVTVALATAPPATVTVDVASADPTKVTVAPAQLVFTPDTWAAPQPVTLTALADADDVDRDSVSVRLTPRGLGSRGVPGEVTVTHREVPPVVVLLRLALKRIQEGRTVPMTVSLSAAPRRVVTVPVVATPGTATPADYIVGPLSVTFGPDETEKTVRVTAVADDLADEPDETVRLAVGPDLPAQVTAGAAAATEVTIEDRTRQAAVQGWLARFGRTAATHVTDAVGDRLRGTPGQAAHLTIGGYRLPVGQKAAGQAAPPKESAATTVLTEVARMLGMGPGAGPQPTPWADRPDPRLGQGRTLTLRRVLMGSAFRLNLGATAADAATPRLTAWGRVAGTTFDGQAGDLALNGDVFTGTVGVDGDWDRLLAGVAVAHSRGDGGFTQPGLAERGQGDLEQTLTSLHPYLRYAVTDRLDVWGLVGYGWGELDLEMENGVTVETDTTLVMGAFGGRGILLAPADTGGFQLATRTDAMLTRTSSDAVANLAATDADAHRLRVLLEGSRAVTWADGRRLTPTVEVGVRHDWGDAETGFGLEVGGRVQYADPTLGLTVEGTVRGLVAHEDDAYQEWGASGTVRLAPGAGGQGLALTLSPTWGATASGVEGLWARQTTQGLAPTAPSAQRGRLAADVGYGFPAFGAGLLTPYAGTVLADGADRTYRVGTRVQLPGLTLNLEGTRQAPPRQPVNQGLRLQVAWGF